MLTSKCRGRAASLVQLAGRNNGLEAWRRLVQDYEPDVGGRHAAVLRAVLNPGWDNKTPFLDQLASWE
eukprot:198711-Alexandrium_andersonii.AAC.1